MSICNDCWNDFAICESDPTFESATNDAVVQCPQFCDALVNEINDMSIETMCRRWRFAPAGDPIFDGSKPYYLIFKKRMDELGGFTPAISKSIGW